MLGLGLILAVFAQINLAPMSSREFNAKVVYWLVILTQHGLARRLGDELPCEARFCTTSRTKRPKRQTSQPRSLLVITMLEGKKRDSCEVLVGAASAVSQTASAVPAGSRTEAKAPSKIQPHCTGGGGGFVGFRSVVSCFVHLSASMESDMRELNSGSIAWRPRHSLTAAALRMEFHFHGGGAAPVLPNL